MMTKHHRGISSVGDNYIIYKQKKMSTKLINPLYRLDKFGVYFLLYKL